MYSYYLGGHSNFDIYSLISHEWLVFKVANSHHRTIVKNCTSWYLVYFLNSYLKLLQFFLFSQPICLQFAWTLQQSQVLIRWMGTNCFLAVSNLKPGANSQDTEGVCVVRCNCVVYHLMLKLVKLAVCAELNILLFYSIYFSSVPADNSIGKSFNIAFIGNKL